jgi:peptidoglycan L-alanyl-D-glutamate endopeptidase CwlK
VATAATVSIMPAKLGAISLARLGECHEDLQRLVREYARTSPWDFTVLCGHRGEKDQEAAFASGASKLHWPKSKHNTYPSRAVDLTPYPVDWKDREAFEDQRRFVLECAVRLAIRIRVISWDLPHFELVNV